jgi:hypothetical protein
MLPQYSKMHWIRKPGCPLKDMGCIHIKVCIHKKTCNAAVERVYVQIIICIEIKLNGGLLTGTNLYYLVIREIRNPVI